MIIYKKIKKKIFFYWLLFTLSDSMIFFYMDNFYNKY